MQAAVVAAGMERLIPLALAALVAAVLRAQLALPLMALQTLVAAVAALDRHHLLAVQEAPALLFLNTLMPIQFPTLVVV
jgi:hypothetical protein